MKLKKLTYRLKDKSKFNNKREYVLLLKLLWKEKTTNVTFMKYITIKRQKENIEIIDSMNVPIYGLEYSTICFSFVFCYCCK